MKFTTLLLAAVTQIAAAAQQPTAIPPEIVVVPSGALRLKALLWLPENGGPFPPVVRNISIEDVGCGSCRDPLFLRGYASAPIRNVRISRCRFEHALKPSTIEHVEGLREPHEMEILVDKKEKALAVKWDDEIVKATALTRDGAVIHPSFAAKSAA